MNSVTQSLCGRDPDVATLKINPENVVMRRSRLHRNPRYMPRRIACSHLRLARIQRRPINRPVGSVVINQSFIRTKPRPAAIDTSNNVDEVTWQPAILGQEVMPVASVVVTSPKVSRCPHHSIH